MLTKAFRIDINPSVKHNPDIRNERDEAANPIRKNVNWRNRASD